MIILITTDADLIVVLIPKCFITINIIIAIRSEDKSLALCRIDIVLLLQML